MLLYLKKKLDELRVDEVHFFRIAHEWAFGKDVDCWNEVAQFKLHGIIPKYVVRFIKYLQSVEKQ